PATELNDDPLVRCHGAVDRVARVPPPGREDAGPHLAGVHDLLEEARRADALEDHGRFAAPALAPHLKRRPFGGVDQDVGAEALGQGAALRFEVRDEDRLDATARERGDRGETDGTGADDDGDLAGPDRGAAHVELADRESVDQRDGVGVDPVGHGAGHGLGHDEQLTEAARSLRVLADDLDAHSPDTIGNEEDGHGGHAGADREDAGTLRAVGDDIANELVAKDDVAVGVVDHPRRSAHGDRIVVIHEVHVGCADRRTHRADEQLARSGDRIRRLSDLELPVAEHDRAHQRDVPSAEPPPAPITPAPISRISLAASLRGTPASSFAPSRIISPTNQVGPFAMLATASAAASSALTAPGIGLESSGLDRTPRRASRRRSEGVSVTARTRFSTSTPCPCHSAHSDSPNTMSKALVAPYATMI